MVASRRWASAHALSGMLWRGAIGWLPPSPGGQACPNGHYALLGCWAASPAPVAGAPSRATLGVIALPQGGAGQPASGGVVISGEGRVRDHSPERTLLLKLARPAPLGAGLAESVRSASAGGREQSSLWSPCPQTAFAVAGQGSPCPEQVGWRSGRPPTLAPAISF